MQIQITAAPDPALIAAATRHGLRRPVLIARLAGWAVLAAAALVLITTGDLHPALLAAGTTLAILVPFVLLNRTARHTLRRGRITTYEISEGGVASSDKVSRHAYAWRAFRSVEELSGQLLFGMDGTRFLPVPTTGLTTAQIEQVLGTASDRGLQVRRRRFHPAG